MTDLIDRVHGESVGGVHESDPIPSWSPATLQTEERRRKGPIVVLLTFLLGCNAVLLMANVGHLSGWRVAVAVAVAWADVVMVVAAIVRPAPLVFGLTIVASVATAVVWLSTNSAPAITNGVLWVGIALGNRNIAHGACASFPPRIRPAMVTVHPGFDVSGSRLCRVPNHGRTAEQPGCSSSGTHDEQPAIIRL